MRLSTDTNSMMEQHIRPLVERIQRRLAGDEGFTLIELMIVLMTVGILMTVAVPTFLSFKDRAAKAAASQSISQAVRAVQSYKADNFPGSRNDPDAGTSTTDTGFEGIDIIGLAKYDASLAVGHGVIINPAGYAGGSASNFCLTATFGRWVAVQNGPDAPVSVGTLFTPATCSVS